MDMDVSRWRDAVADVFEVYDVTALPDRSGTVRLRGRLLIDSDKAYATLAPRLRAQGYTILFRQEKEDQVILIVPGVVPQTSPRIGPAVILFILTLVSVLYTGAVMEATDANTIRLLDGLPFAVSLLSILLAHEFGHYIVARRLGASVSLPYFIPLPTILPYFFSPFGTMGAVIVTRSPTLNRRALLAIGVAGPLAGLVIAVPVLIYGLSLSQVRPLPPGQLYTQEGNSLLYLAIKFAMFGRILPSNGVDVSLHSVAFAGWAGLLVTALNLIPAGQLDGGHIVYALLGERARAVTAVIIVALLALGLVWNGWWLWALLVAVFGQVRAMPLDAITRLDRPRQVLAVLIVVLFFLIFTPIPLAFRVG
ncbi:MAG: site-2 protease family protein [Anaerolineae bacterium]|nr:site-2 protease family protein [Anaerolineae bacterium]